MATETESESDDDDDYDDDYVLDDEERVSDIADTASEHEEEVEVEVEVKLDTEHVSDDDCFERSKELLERIWTQQHCSCSGPRPNYRQPPPADRYPLHGLAYYYRLARGLNRWPPEPSVEENPSFQIPDISVVFHTVLFHM